VRTHAPLRASEFNGLLFVSQEDPLYIGLPMPRRPMKELEALVDEFMSSVEEK
jgi:hypothetical protein